MAGVDRRPPSLAGTLAAQLGSLKRLMRRKRTPPDRIPPGLAEEFASKLGPFEHLLKRAPDGSPAVYKAELRGVKVGRDGSVVGSEGVTLRGPLAASRAERGEPHALYSRRDPAALRGRVGADETEAVIVVGTCQLGTFLFLGFSAREEEG